MKLKRAVWSVLKFELVWKLLTLIIISPLFDQVYQTYVSSVGVSFNANVLGTFLNLKGALIFLALFLAAGLLAFYELSVVIRLAALSRQGEVFSIRHVMKQALWSLRAMKGWSVVPSSCFCSPWCRRSTSIPWCLPSLFPGSFWGRCKTPPSVWQASLPSTPPTTACTYCCFSSPCTCPCGANGSAAR